MFDTSGSFTKDMLSKYISEESSNRNIDYYDISESSIPINMWDTSLFEKHVDRKNYISSLISSVFETVKD